MPQQSESTTGRAGTRVAVRLWDCTSQSRQARARSEGKNRLFDSEINLHRLFETIYCCLRRYPVGAHSVRPSSAKSYGSWANNVRPYGIDCTDRKYFPELTIRGQFFSSIQHIGEGRTIAGQGKCSSASAGVRTNRRLPEPMKLLHRTEQNTALLGINRAYSHAHRFFSPRNRYFSSGKRHFSSGKSTEQRRAEDRTEEESRAEHSREQQSRNKMENGE